jgi:hypothetical protein
MSLFLKRSILVIMVLLTACTTQSSFRLAPESALPEFLHDDSLQVRVAYRFAIANPDELRNYPCYCGCVAIDHASNLDCYISDIAEDGMITFEGHGAGCGTCVEITQDVIRLRNAGQTRLQTRNYIDEQYRLFGPSTNTPMPTE